MITFAPPYLGNAQAVINTFGLWPDFRDAEMYGATYEKKAEEISFRVHYGDHVVLFRFWKVSGENLH
jgi:hypothetical protein